MPTSTRLRAKGRFATQEPKFKLRHYSRPVASQFEIIIPSAVIAKTAAHPAIITNHQSRGFSTRAKLANFPGVPHRPARAAWINLFAQIAAKTSETHPTMRPAAFGTARVC
jgi:hypothetical protein